jgi:hypothetical protein
LEFFAGNDSREKTDFHLSSSVSGLVFKFLYNFIFPGEQEKRRKGRGITGRRL